MEISTDGRWIGHERRRVRFVSSVPPTRSSRLRARCLSDGESRARSTNVAPAPLGAPLSNGRRDVSETFHGRRRSAYGGRWSRREIRSPAVVFESVPPVTTVHYNSVLQRSLKGRSSRDARGNRSFRVREHSACLPSILPPPSLLRRPLGAAGRTVDERFFTTAVGDALHGRTETAPAVRRVLRTRARGRLLGRLPDKARAPAQPVPVVGGNGRGGGGGGVRTRRGRRGRSGQWAAARLWRDRRVRAAGTGATVRDRQSSATYTRHRTNTSRPRARVHAEQRTPSRRYGPRSGRIFHVVRRRRRRRRLHLT